MRNKIISVFQKLPAGSKKFLKYLLKKPIIIILVLVLITSVIIFTRKKNNLSISLNDNTFAASEQDQEKNNEFEIDKIADAFSYEYDMTDDFTMYEENADIFPEWMHYARWFRSNAGGMALEEIPARLPALQNEYALVIDYVSHNELPEYLLTFYNNNFYLEKRILFKDSLEKRVQWIFKDKNGTTRLISAFSDINSQSENENLEDQINIENQIIEEDIKESFKENENSFTEESSITNTGFAANEDFVNGMKNGFIEIFDENSSLVTEIKYADDGSIYKTEYAYKDGKKITAKTFLYNNQSNDTQSKDAANKSDMGYVLLYTDYFKYNRSSFLRAVERFFFKDINISSSKNLLAEASDIESSLIVFPGNIFNAAKGDNFINEKFNPYPDFFENLSVNEKNRMVYATDDKGKILSQTLYDNDDKIIWSIHNVWSKDRIASTTKKEGDIELIAEYEYDSEGNRIIERNLKNGALERIVRTENKISIEELYMNNVLVLTAVWEDDKKISETMIKRH